MKHLSENLGQTAAAGRREPRKFLAARRPRSRGLKLPYGEIKESVLAWARHREGIVLPSELPFGTRSNFILLDMARRGLCRKLGPNTHGGKYEPQFVFAAFIRE